MNVAFRAANKADTDALVQFVREYYVFDHRPFDETLVRSTLQTLLENDTYGRMWMIEDAGEAVGYVVLTFGFSLEDHGRDALVDELYVREAYRGRGVGGAALDFLESFCRSAGIRVIYLEVERENTAAQHFYYSRGFTDDNRYLLTRQV